MVENSDKDNIIAIMNDRAQGGSAYDNGRLELMINRRGYTDDGLGMSEPLNEVDAQGFGLNVSAQFFVKFSQSREEAYRAVSKQYFLTNNQPHVAYSDSFTSLSTLSDSLVKI